MQKLYLIILAWVLLSPLLPLPTFATDSEKKFWFELREVAFRIDSVGVIKIHLSVDTDADGRYISAGEVAIVSVGNVTKNQTISALSPSFSVSKENDATMWTVAITDEGLLNSTELMLLEGIIRLIEPVYAAFTRTWYNDEILYLNESGSSLRISTHEVRGTMNLQVHLVTALAPSLRADFAIDVDASGTFESDEISNSSGQPSNGFLQLNSSEISSIELQSRFQISLTNLESNAAIVSIEGIWDFMSNISIPLNVHWFNASEIDWLSYGLRFNRSIREIRLDNREIVHSKKAGTLETAPEELIQITVSRKLRPEAPQTPTTEDSQNRTSEDSAPNQGSSTFPRIEPFSLAVGAVATIASAGILVLLWRRRKYV